MMRARITARRPLPRARSHGDAGTTVARARVVAPVAPRMRASRRALASSARRAVDMSARSPRAREDARRDRGVACGRGRASVGSALSLAPGLDVTTPQFRALARAMTRRARLWTEMAHHDAVERRHASTMVLGERAVTAQLGGSSASGLARATEVLVDEYGYDEVNLNCGCPSERVCAKDDESRCFGAAMMLNIENTAECARRMAEVAGGSKITVKHRLGVRFDKTMTKTEATDGYDHVVNFVEAIKDAAGVEHFIVHARSAVMGGLSTIANRSVPPLRYDEVFALCDEFGACDFTLNGGVKNLDDAKALLERDGGKLAGVMMGRAFYQNPCMLADVDRVIFGEAAVEPPLTRRSLAKIHGEYVDAEFAKYTPDVMNAKFRKSLARNMFRAIDGITYGSYTGARAFHRAADAWLAREYDHLPATPEDDRPYSENFANFMRETVDEETLDEPLINVPWEGKNTRRLARHLTKLHVSNDDTAREDEDES